MIEGGWGWMQDEFTRAKHYLELAKEMRRIAQEEPDVNRKSELLSLARQYDRLAAKLTSEALAIFSAAEAVSGKSRPRGHS